MDKQSIKRVIVSRRSRPRRLHINPPSPIAIIHDCQGSGQTDAGKWLWWEANEVKIMAGAAFPLGEGMNVVKCLMFRKRINQYYVKYQILVITATIVSLVDHNYIVLG